MKKIKKCWRNKTSLVLTLLFFLSPFIVNAAAPSISGVVSVCEGDIVTYTFPYSAGNVYNWNATGGTGIATINAGTGNATFTVTWGLAVPGPHTVGLQEYSGGVLVSNLTLNVTVNVAPNPLIVSDFDSDCVTDPVREKENRFIAPQKPDLFECETVCEDSPVTYTTPNVAGNTYQWTVIGAYTSISGATTNSATVTWGSPGQAYVVVTETTPAGCTQTDTTCIVIVDKPIAKFEVDHGGPIGSSQTIVGANTIEICLNSTVCFNDLSSGASSWSWDFGNSNSSNLQNPCETYTTPGNYLVTQIVENECHCLDTSYINVKVRNEVGPEIVCQNVVCDNGTFTYNAILPTPCVGGYYEWVISNNGTITGAAGGATITPQTADGVDVTSIDVYWGSGPVGTISLVLSGCGSVCDAMTTVNIPIIPNTINIEGDEVVCVGEAGFFEVPCYPGTIYTWKVNGNPVAETGNELWYQFYSPGTYTVTVEYDNNFLSCSGSSSDFNVRVLSPFEINGASKVCAGSPLTVNGPAGSQLTWVVTNQSGTIVASSGSVSSSFNVPGSLTPGTYTVTAQDVSSPRDYCNDYAVHGFTVIAKPPTPTVINGPIIVCINEASIYTASPISSDYYLEWEVNNGGTVTTSNGNSVSVTWGAGVKTIILRHVSKQNDCPSDDYLVVINEKVPPVITQSDFTGPTTVCANTPTGAPIGYSMPLSLDGYSWSIVPANAGSVVSGQGTTNISVIWNNYSGPASVVLTPTTCNVPGSAVAYNVNVTNPVMSISGPSVVCQNSGGTWTSSFTMGVPGPHTWTVQNIATGATVTLPGTGSVISYNFPTSGSFVITGTATNCSTTHTVTQNVTVNPAPVANLTYSGDKNCIDNNIVDFFVSVQGTGPYTYTWYHGASVILGVTGPNHTIGNNPADAGNYSVVITDANGCSSTTNIVRVRRCGPPPSCTNHGSSISYTYNVYQNAPSPGCDVVRFNATALGLTPTQVRWNFADLGSATGYMPTFQFPASGVYPVTVIASYGAPLCDKIYTFNVVVPVVANYELNISCPSGNTFLVNLINTTDVVHGPLSLFNHLWTVYDMTAATTLGTSTSQDYMGVPGLIGGNVIQVTLQETRTYTWGGQTINASCTYVNTFTMPENANADFSVVNPVVCEGNPLSFTDLSAGNIVSWDWNFGDGSGILTQSPDKTYTTPGTYSANLMVTDEFGCTSTSANQTITVKANAISGNINVTPVSPMCPGTVASIVFTNTTSPSSAPYNYLWSDGTTTGTAASSATTTTQTSTHYLGVTDSYGCFQSFGPATVEVVEIPDAIITGLDEYCIGDDINLTCNYGNSYGYQWLVSIGGAPFTSAGSTNPQLTMAGGLPIGNHVFKVELSTTSPNCVKESFLFPVEVFGLPAAPVITTNPVPACPDSPVLLTVTNPGLYNSISWTTGDVGVSTSAISAGKYYAVGTDINGCSNYSFTEVHELPNFCSFMCGCYSDCIESGTAYNFPGIPGTFQNWRWERFDGVNWNPIASGSGAVADLSITTPGAYTIRLYVETLDGCDGYSCEVDLMLTACSDPCEGKAYFEYVECVHTSVGVVYEFGMGIDFAPFGKKCDQYSYQIIPPVGSVISTPSTITPYGSFIHGKWTVGSNYYPGGKVCFEVIITNECDQTTCSFTVCIDFPKCGDADASSRTKSSKGIESQNRFGNSEKGEITFYPNPSSGLLKVNVPEVGNYEISIFDITGKAVFKHTLNVETPRDFEFNLQDLPLGPYHIQFIGNNSIKTETLIIMK